MTPLHKLKSNFTFKILNSKLNGKCEGLIQRTPLLRIKCPLEF
jgi:hypothetical protein